MNVSTDEECITLFICFYLFVLIESPFTFEIIAYFLPMSLICVRNREKPEFLQLMFKSDSLYLKFHTFKIVQILFYRFQYKKILQSLSSSHFNVYEGHRLDYKTAKYFIFGKSLGYERFVLTWSKILFLSRIFTK